jgi:hypothetical protein
MKFDEVRQPCKVGLRPAIWKAHIDRSPNTLASPILNSKKSQAHEQWVYGGR